jgi:deoxyinosine 3'endonuclease (endonuclease V)
MILAFDVAYNENNIAQAVAVGFDHWSDAEPKVIYREFVIGLDAYKPGEFYKRELPCIEKILNKIDLRSINLIIVDGYVFLDDAGYPGLGAHLFELLEKKIPVVGIAKTNFANNVKNVREVLRGESSKPLYVSAIGVDVDEVAGNVKTMQGDYRIPTLLKKLDQLTKR